MADIELVVKIPEEVYNYITRLDLCNMAEEYIKNGTLLPKGHWIDDEFGSKCSCCGIHTHLDRFNRPMKFMYCSMRGCRMVEPQESEILDEQIQALKEFVNNLEQVEKGVYRVTEK